MCLLMLRKCAYECMYVCKYECMYVLVCMYVMCVCVERASLL